MQTSNHHHRSIRLREYDYSSAGSYFVTICVYDKKCLFGDNIDGEMKLNEFGTIVKNEWLLSAKIRNGIVLDEWVVMPNHFHGIICRGTARRAPTMIEKFGRPVCGSIPTIVRSFKSAVTKRINELRQTPGAKLWQRNYYEHIIRNDISLNKIREYIINNPSNWNNDELNGKYYDE